MYPQGLLHDSVEDGFAAAGVDPVDLVISAHERASVTTFDADLEGKQVGLAQGGGIESRHRKIIANCKSCAPAIQRSRVRFFEKLVTRSKSNSPFGEFILRGFEPAACCSSLSSPGKAHRSLCIK
jgi:hypothetical protein